MAGIQTDIDTPDICIQNKIVISKDSGREYDSVKKYPLTSKRQANLAKYFRKQDKSYILGVKPKFESIPKSMGHNPINANSVYANYNGELWLDGNQKEQDSYAWFHIITKNGMLDILCDIAKAV